MNEVRLSKMEIRNFKGIREFILDAMGRNVFVYGENGKGKSTLRDAFLWCLFGKDGANRTEGKGGFDLETFQPGTNEPIHAIDHMVEVVLSIDGKVIKFRRLYAEKWTKKHGATEKKLDGHTTNYWVDDEPLSQKEYQSRISSIINEELFRLLTNPLYFNDDKAFPWEKRRKLLLEMAGGMTDEEILASDPELAKLRDVLNGKSIDAYKKIVNERVKLLKKQQEGIPPRIDEQHMILAGETNVDYTSAENSLKHFKDLLAAIEAEQMSITNVAKTYRQKQQELISIQTTLDTRKKALDDQANVGLKHAINEKTSLLNEKYKSEAEKNSLRNRTEDNANQVIILSKEMATLRDEWNKENAKSYIPPDSDADEFICPTCQRPLAVESVEQKLREMEEHFYALRQTNLDRINRDGKSVKIRKEALEAEGKTLEESFLKCQAHIQEINESIAEIDKELSLNTGVKINYMDDTQFKRLMQEQQAIQQELSKPIEDQSAELLQKKQDVMNQIEEVNRILNMRDTADKAKARIKELETEEKQVAQQISDMEHHKYLIEQFVKRKVSLLEEGINGKFKAVRFQMFENQINDGIKECCNTLILSDNGAWVDFNTNGNTAAKINAGVDIINGLAAHYGITGPIFLDNRESVNDLIQTDSQVINLFVSKDQHLRIEVEE